MKWINSLIIAACLSLSLMATAEEPAPVNLNTATAEQLAELNGIGKTKAEAIVQYRSENGGFKTLEELKEVKGIGDALLEKNRGLLALE